MRVAKDGQRISYALRRLQAQVAGSSPQLASTLLTAPFAHTSSKHHMLALLQTGRQGGGGVGVGTSWRGTGLALLATGAHVTSQGSLRRQAPAALTPQAQPGPTFI